ncbi:threonine ammonia-lyase [Phytoactinopolyspora halotolerans]|uniref:Pyridoxal-phosphate dependent enzyme n=1 Tax=Phytoactinopolyspora halotolerans TaxID=1981512 RepID=A0A6L9S9B8_9ACTN|nr:pyridoxal-phosphate dependent enzyme [Phytoactinopolyspora halotolerans]NEE01975.1 pyridoxal-phosphate dependent enzyme [Phytoactinopolyspora halotolerans]
MDTPPVEADIDIDLDRITEAATVIDPAFLNTPQYVDEQLSARLGRRLMVKVETLNPLRSFKGRGATFHVRQLPVGSTAVCASGGGNFGQAIAYAAAGRGLNAAVFVPATMSRVKVERMESFGARVHVVDGDHQQAARTFADSAPERVMVEDGRDVRVAEGAGTIGLELTREGGFDTLVLPVGDGALITGVARWVKAHEPDVRVVGVGAAAAPALVESWRAGEVMRIEPRNAFAAGISIGRPYPEAVLRTRALVDDMVLVEDDELVAAMHLAATTLGVLPEPAGAAGIAAVAGNHVSGERIATVITGANADLELYADAWPRSHA